MRTPFSSLALAAFVIAVATTLAAGCDDPCASGADPTVAIGRLVGTAGFEPLEDGEEVTLTMAPQGGVGIASFLRTVHLAARPDFVIFARQVEVTLRVDDAAGENLGEFFLVLSDECVNDEHGLVSGATFGLNFDVTPEQVAGKDVTLGAVVKDAAGQTASDEVDVVISSDVSNVL